MLKLSFLFLKPVKSCEAGRSFTEMLAMLAIMGILSIIGVLGYRYMVIRHAASDTLSELHLRSIDLSQQRMSGQLRLEMAMGNRTRMGYPVSARISPQYPGYFEIFIEEVPARVCVEILKSEWQVPYSIFVETTEYEGNTDICEVADTVRLAYEFTDDLRSKADIDEDNRHKIQRCYADLDCSCGSCSDGLCHSYCPENAKCVRHYDDPSSLVCCLKESVVNNFCCAHVDAVGNCCDFSGNCCPADKPLVGKDGTCYACDDTRSLVLSHPDACSFLCPDRRLNNNLHKRCILCGAPGTIYEDKPLWDYLGNCYACDEPKRIDMGVEALAQQTYHYCSGLCPNRQMFERYCSAEGCPSDKPLMDVKATCHACDDPNPFIAMNTEECTSLCPGRRLNNEAHKQCISCGMPGTVNEDKPIWDWTGKCYSCDEVNRIDMGIEAEAQETWRYCSELCPNRRMVERYCIQETCPAEKPLMDTYGLCHACDDPLALTLMDPNECSALCPERRLNNEFHKKCISCGMAGTVNENKPLWNFAGTCYACEFNGVIDMGSETEARETLHYCTDFCSNRVVNDHYCLTASCGEDLPLRGANNICYSCDEVSRVNVAGVPENCAVCPNRQLDGNLCVLPCPADKPIQSPNGSCHSCDEENAFSVLNDTDCESCPGRRLNNEFHKQCITCGMPGTVNADKPIWDWTGKCYDCNDKTSFNMGIESLASLSWHYCTDLCPNRILNGQTCIRNTCLPGYFADKVSKECIPCNIGTNIDATQEECDRCLNRSYQNGLCILTE